ncbi:SRPBCC family protein [Terrabacter sp. NPDC080008]|uniref:SRPBCC family protein n=1 Tax=Terrabacter sp. NPDC080008 TaxID=3155176 RepID=UPI00344D6563
MRSSITVTGDAEPAIAWSRYENLSLWPTWSPQISDVIAATPTLSTGLTGLVVGPLGVRVPFEVLDVDAEAMEWRWHVRYGPVQATLEHTVRSAPGGCATGLVIDGPALVVLGYRPLAQLALGRLVRRDL